jgi:signal transduction histidine kinase
VPAPNHSSSTKVGLRLLALSLITVVALVVAARGGLASIGLPALSGLGVLMLITDLGAVRLPGAGFATCSFGIALLMGLDSQVGLTLAAISVVISQVVTYVARPSHISYSVAAVATLVEAAPQLMGLAAMSLVSHHESRGFVGSVVYLTVILFVPEQLACLLPQALAKRLLTIEVRLMLIRACACLWGLLISALYLSKGYFYLALGLPILFFLRQSGQTVLELDEQTERQDVMRQLTKSHQLLDASSKHQSELQKNLSEKSKELRLLEVSANVFLNPENPVQTAQKIIQLCGQLTTCASTVVYLFDGKILVPAAHSTPYAARLSGAVLSGIREPMVELAWRTGQLQAVPSGHPDQRIFQGESVALAFPWTGLGVLYLGRQSNPFQESEHRFLQQAASLGGLGLRISLQLEELHKSLDYQQSLSAQLNQRSNSLDQLLRHSLQFMGTLKREELQEILKSALQELFQNCHCSVNLATTPMSQIEAMVCEAKNPMVIDDLSATRSEPPVEGAVSLMAVPILHQGLDQVGVLLVTSKVKSAFGRHERDLLMILSYLASVAWKNAELHEATLAAQSQLVQSSKMAAVGQLADGVAHELNTPLGSIALNLDFAKQMLPAGSEKVQARLQKASDMLTRTQSIVEKLLYYSRESKSGRRPTQLMQLVQDTIELIGHALARDQVEVIQTVDPALMCEVNQNEIQQVIFNLLLNARDAVATLDVDRRQVVVLSGQTQDRVFLKVVDRGCGIASTFEGRVFEPFFTTKPVGSGTGLGLSVSLQIVKAHGGDLRFQSQEGKGSEFILELPRFEG